MRTKPFSRLGLLQRVSTAYPWMPFLSRPLSSSIDGFNGGKKLRSRSSEENMNKLSDFMDNVDDDLLKLCMEFPQTDLLREDPEVFWLINAYFTTSKAVSELIQSLRKYLERVEHDEFPLIDKALRDFEEEKLGYGGKLDGSFRKTVQDLRNLNELYETSDLGCEDLLRKIQMCHEELKTVIVNLEKREKKLKRVRGPRAIIAAFTTCSTSRRKRSTEDLEREKAAVTSMKRGTMVALIELKKIRRLLNIFDSVERSIRAKAEFAVKNS